MEGFGEDGEALLQVLLGAAAALEAAREPEPLENIDVVEDLERVVQLECVLEPVAPHNNQQFNAGLCS